MRCLHCYLKRLIILSSQKSVCCSQINTIRKCWRLKFLKAKCASGICGGIDKSGISPRFPTTRQLFTPAHQILLLLLKNAHMGDATSQRVNSALSSLIDNLVLCSSEEDKATTDKRRNNALGWAKGVINRHVNVRKTKNNFTNVLYSRGEPDVVSDVNHASDLIKKKRRRLA